MPQQNAPASSAAPAKQPFGLMDTWPAKLAQSIYGAITLPGDVYKGDAAVPQSANMPGGENTENIGRAFSLAALGNPVAPEAQGLTKVGPPTAEQLKTASQTLYNQAKDLPIEVNPKAMQLFNTGLKAKLNEDGLNDVVAGKTFGVLDKLAKPLPPGPDEGLSSALADAFGGRPEHFSELQGVEAQVAGMTPNNLRTIQRSLGTIKNTSNDPTERMTAGIALKEFNNLLENMSPSFLNKGTPEDAAQFSSLVKEANQNYQAYKGASSFDMRGEVAGNNAAAANSGMNLENSLRTQVRQILNNPAKQRGIDPDTLAAMKAFNNGSRTANVVRMVGNLFGGGGGIGTLISGGAGMSLGLPPEALPAIGYGMKSFANARAARQFGQISDMMRANSPLANSGVTNIQPRPAATALGARAPLTLPQLLGLLQPKMPVMANPQSNPNGT